MINKFAVKFYGMMPKSIKTIMGRASYLKPLRDLLFRKDQNYKEVFGQIKKSYHGYDLSFRFYGSLQNVAKAKQKGIESTLLNHSIELLNAHKNHNEDCVILDIGSNFGFLSLVWASSVSKNNGRVYSFEPNNHVYDTFLKSVKSNELGSVIMPEYCAVGNRNETIQLFLNNTTSNVLDSSNTNDIVDVNMITIDAFVAQNTLDRCDLIKIDVDGIELDILKGCQTTLDKLRPLFIVETNHDIEIINFFNHKNYKILDMNLKEYSSGDVLPVNIFCVPN